MEHMSVKSRFIDNLNNKFPADFHGVDLKALISDQMFSETPLVLPAALLPKIQEELNQYHQLRLWGVKNLNSEYLKHGLRTPKNYGVCNSFDFHVTETGEIKLIEINTNAAFLAMGLLLYETLELDPQTGFNQQHLVKMFADDAKACGVSLEHLAIMDENPTEQRLFIEFLAYQAVFKKYGLTSEIIDMNSVTSNQFPYVYNRYTDFYLSEEKSVALKKLFNSDQVQLSPNPYEYFLLADKKRMFDWQQQTEVPIPKSLLKIYDLGKEDREHIWSLRKNLFFKPKNSFGSKQVYGGQKISRRLFDEFYGDNMIAQELAIPAEFPVKLETGDPTLMKYDLRCFCYQEKLQLVIARLYQGQTTNLRTPGGGFTVVKFQ